MSGRVRLQKLLARAGVASRRAAEELIREGRVRVNGKTVTTLGTTVDPDDDVVSVDGSRIETEPPVWIALNKPAGYVTTRKDPRGRRTVYDLLPREHRRLLHVGRLDTGSEGLLLLTNDGDGAHRLLHPRFGVERTYTADVEGLVGAEVRERLIEGVHLSDGIARASAARILAGPRQGIGRLSLTLREGRNREVRRMLDAVGHPVIRLRRVAYGPVRLGRLARGAWRPLMEDERRWIDAAAKVADGS
jgi:23S rRNA pseudouridine2605 synthase